MSQAHYSNSSISILSYLQSIVQISFFKQVVDSFVINLEEWAVCSDFEPTFYDLLEDVGNHARNNATVFWIIDVLQHSKGMQVELLWLFDYFSLVIKSHIERLITLGFESACPNELKLLHFVESSQKFIVWVLKLSVMVRVALWDYDANALVEDISKHRVRLSWSCLSIGEDCAIVSSEEVLGVALNVMKDLCLWWTLV